MKIKIFCALLLIIGVWGLMSPNADAKVPVTHRKKIIYKKHTILDFSAQTVQGKVRAPEIFYIFQRRKSAGHEVVITPKNLHYQSQLSIASLKAGLPHE